MSEFIVLRRVNSRLEGDIYPLSFTGVKILIQRDDKEKATKILAQ